MILTHLADKLRIFRFYGNKRFAAAALLLLVCLLGLGSAAQQRRRTHKLRAVALLELTTDAKGKTFAHLTAVTLYDQGQLYDGSVYKAKPAPMALDTGVIYEAQKTGVAVGNVTISSGESRRGVWTAAGSWRLVEAQTKPEAPAPVAVTPAADDRPILRKPGSTPAPASVPVAAPAPSPVKAGPSTEQADDDSERPRLARKPIPQPSANAGKPGEEAAGPPVTRQILVAVSDAQASDSRSYEFPWKPDEKIKIEAQMRQLAAAQFPRELHISTNALANVVIRSFDTDMSNDAVEVLTAEVPGTGSGAKAAPGKPVTHYVTLIARVDMDGGPQKVAAFVTDSSRLDVVPRYELIDAVDVDGSNVADILFRAYSFDQRSLVLYSVGRSSATKIFDGASQPLP